MYLESKVYKRISEEDLKEVDALVKATYDLKCTQNDLRRELEKSKNIMSYWYRQQKAAKAECKGSPAISIKALYNKNEIYSPAMDHWDTDIYPSRAVLHYAMYLYYKELIKFGEKVHTELKNKFKESCKNYGKAAKVRDEIISKYNNKYRPMWLPCKVVPKEETKDKHWDLYINHDKDYKTILPQFAWADVNPNNMKNGKPHYFRLDSRFDNFLYLTNDDLSEIIYYSDEEIKNLKAGSPLYRDTIMKYNELLKKNHEEGSIIE